MSIHTHFFKSELESMGHLTQKETGEWQVDVTELLEYVDELRDGEKRIGQAMRLLLPPLKEVAQKNYERATSAFTYTILVDETRNAEFERMGYRLLFLWTVAAWDLWEYRSTEHTESRKFMLADYMIFLLHSFETRLENMEACTCH